MSENRSEKWWKAMEKTYGSKDMAREAMAMFGAKGGMRSSNGGFASRKRGSDGLTGKERARKAGKKGGEKKASLSKTKLHYEKLESED